MGNSKRDEIEHAACCLLLSKGLNKTTYQDVADLSGYARTYVQYYLPNKAAFATTFYSRMAQRAKEFLQANLPVTQESHPIELAHYVGLVTFAFLQYDDNMRRLTKEMLESRLVSERISAIEREWAEDQLFTVKNQSNTSQGFAKFTFIMGGAFECLYSAMVEGETVDPELIAKTLVLNTCEFYDMSTEEATAHLEASKLSSEDVDKACQYLYGCLGVR